MSKDTITIEKQELVNIIDATVMKAMLLLPRRRREFYTKRQIQELFEVSLNTVSVWDKEGKIIRRPQHSARVTYTKESVEQLFISRNL